MEIGSTLIAEPTNPFNPLLDLDKLFAGEPLSGFSDRSQIPSYQLSGLLEAERLTSLPKSSRNPLLEPVKD